VRDYLAAIRTGKDSTDVTARFRLTSFFDLVRRDIPLSSVTAKSAAIMYRARLDKVAVATHHGELGYARRFFAWCVDRGWVRANPFDDVEPVGTKNRGKPKLRVSASRQFLEYLVRDPSAEATAAMMAFVLGLRASEVVKRTADDLDDDGWLLWIRDTKTRAGDREIEVPELLRLRLVELTRGMGPKDRIFGDMTRYGLHYHVGRLCDAAGVPRVSPHGLRGSGATNAVRMGGSVASVARAMGHEDHASGAVTLRRHYLAGGAEESSRGRQVMGLLTPGVTDYRSSARYIAVTEYGKQLPNEEVNSPECGTPAK
jgi:integrase